jgi:hypothetical protein
MWQSEDQRSKPVLNGTQIGGQWAAKRLVPSRLQFLQPPAGVAELLRQTICVSIHSTVFDEIAAVAESGIDPRRALLRHDAIREALEIARDNPINLTPLQRDFLHRVFPFLTARNPSVLPIPFAKPFDAYAMTSGGDLNLLHLFGETLCRALGAIGIAEAEGKFQIAQLEKLHRDCMSHDFFIFNVRPKFDIAKFWPRLSQLVVDSGFVPNFKVVNPPQEKEVVPGFKRPTQFNIVGFRKRYSGGLPLGPFGSVITSWP